MINIRFRFLAIGTAFLGTALAVVCWDSPVTLVAMAGQAPGSFNSGQPRATEDPATVAHGKTLYGINCQACHGADLRGGDMGGPNLLRSQAALSDQHGEMIVPIIQGARQAQGMPNIGLSDQDAGAVAAYLRSMIGAIGSQGKPPGEEKPLDIVVGDPGRGSNYFAAHCNTCHSTTDDLKGIASRFPEPKTLQARWLAGGPLTGRNSAATKATAEVTTKSGQPASGSLVHIDDFLVTLRLSDGTERSYRRDGPTPRVVVHDPLQKHRDMLPTYTDENVHDITAYLVTLK